jgi:cytochrome d ubiquinol oxidase subunit II
MSTMTTLLAQTDPAPLDLSAMGIGWLHILWFVLLGVLLVGYAILDGFDLGVGILHLGAKGDEERRIFINSIGPIWDGNEVWLVTFGGALFAAFYQAYATAFSAFYVPFMLLLYALIFRAVSIEFRSKRQSPRWRKFFDFTFFLSSLLASLLFGVAVGSTMSGIPIDGAFEFSGGFFDLLGFFPVLVGLFVVVMFAMHGSIYLYLKTEGALQERIRNWNWSTFGLFLVLYLFTTIYALVNVPQATTNFERYEWAWGIVFLNILAIANIPRALYLRKPLMAFVSSCCTIAAFVFLYGMALFPYMLISTDPTGTSLTIGNAAASDKTLTIMAIIAALGMPFVLAYTIAIYWTFRGKTKIGEFSY